MVVAVCFDVIYEHFIGFINEQISKTCWLSSGQLPFVLVFKNSFFFRCVFKHSHWSWLQPRNDFLWLLLVIIVYTGLHLFRAYVLFHILYSTQFDIMFDFVYHSGVVRYNWTNSEHAIGTIAKRRSIAIFKCHLKRSTTNKQKKKKHTNTQCSHKKMEKRERESPERKKENRAETWSKKVSNIVNTLSIWKENWL